MRYLLFFILLISTVGWCREFGCKLNGNELLCEMTTMSPGKNPPGIYAFNPNSGNAVRIIPFGHHPVWSPDHKKFAYFYDKSICIADIEHHSVDEVADDFDNYNLWWLPDNTHIIFNQHSKPLNSFLPTSIYIKDHSTEKFWQREKVEQVGNMSIKLDNNKIIIAYESITLVPGFFPINPVIRITEMGSTQYTTIKSDLLKEALCFNPQWQPHGLLLAFDAYYYNTGVSKIMLWNSVDNSVTEMPFWDRVSNYVKHANESHYINGIRLLSWSPSGKTVLVNMFQNTESDSMHGGYLITVPIDQKEEIKDFVGLNGIIHAGISSPDGGTIASIKSFSQNPTTGTVSFLILYNSAGVKDRDIIANIPERLQATYINW